MGYIQIQYKICSSYTESRIIRRMREDEVTAFRIPPTDKVKNLFPLWKMKTAVGGGPVLLQNGEIKITNNEELKFAGKAIDDKHPRTAMGYTKDNKLIILVIEGRNPGKAEGATLTQEAQILKTSDAGKHSTLMVAAAVVCW